MDTKIGDCLTSEKPKNRRMKFREQEHVPVSTNEPILKALTSSFVMAFDIFDNSG